MLLTRGHIDYVEKFIRDLRTRFLPIKIYNKKKKKMETRQMRMRVCPIQLWDISYPKETQDAVLTTCLAGDKGKPIHKRNNKFIWALRKMFGLKKLPDYNTEQQLIMEPPEHIELLGIGVKDDYYVTETGEHVNEKNKTEFSTEGI